MAYNQMRTKRISSYGKSKKPKGKKTSSKRGKKKY